MSILSESEDAYGHQMWDHMHGRRTYEIVERDDGYIDLSGGATDYFAEYRKWPSHQKAALRFVRGRVLDIGCGAGRCLLYLQRIGHDAVGVDISPLAVRTCLKRGAKRALLCPITQIGPGLGQFDTILMFGNNFGLFGNYSRARWLLRRFRHRTSRNARIIAETLDPYGTTLPEHRRYHRLNRERDRMSGQVRIRVRYRDYVTPWFDYLLVSPTEMKSILAGTGWHLARTFQGPSGAYTAVINKVDL